MKIVSYSITASPLLYHFSASKQTGSIHQKWPRAESGSIFWLAVVGLVVTDIAAKTMWMHFSLAVVNLLAKVVRRTFEVQAPDGGEQGENRHIFHELFDQARTLIRKKVE